MSASDPTETVPPFPDESRGEALPEGSTIAGRFEVRRLLGEGGSAEVYEVHDRELGCEVALKLLRSDRASSRAVLRLRRETLTGRDMAHPRLIRIFDLGSAREGTYLTMELMRGGSLKGRLAKGPLPVEEAIRIGVQIFEGLAALHKRACIHRDVKPGNILFDEHGGVKLADFGLVRRIDRDETRATAHEGFVGTLPYLSPEQRMGNDPDPRSDLYSAGVTLFEMLTGRLPHEVASDAGRTVGHLKEAPDIRALRPEVPGWLAMVVRRLLARDPSDRYSSAEEVLGHLESHRSPGMLPSKRRRLALTSGILALAAVVGTAVLGSRGRGSTFAHLAPRGENAIAAIGTRGETLWQREGVDPEIAERAALVRISPDLPPRLAVVLHPRGRFDIGRARTLSLLEPETGAVVGEVPLPADVGHFPWMPTRFRPEVLSAIDLDRDGIDEIFITFIHVPEWPSYTILYEPKIGRVREVFFGSGHHRFAGAQDLDGDGRAELLFVGINNRLGWINALAAVRLDPWANEEPSRHVGPVASPDAAVSDGERAGLLWYALLPRGTVTDDKPRLTIDARHRSLTIQYVSGKEEVVGFDGFTRAPRSGLPPREREAAQKRAFRHFQETERLAAARSFPAALEEIVRGIGQADRAVDPRLREALQRVHGKILVLDGRTEEAEALFRNLVERPENAPEVAFDAAVAFHLAGDLSRAVGWYRRGMGIKTLESGKTMHEYVKGELMALVEDGRIAEARRSIETFAASYPSFRGATLYREFVRWRAGEVPRVEEVEVGPTAPDLDWYWHLEYRYAAGEAPQALLREVEKELAFRPETRAELLSLKAELLGRLGRESEAAETAERALELARAEAPRSIVARAHIDLIEERAVALRASRGATDR